MMPLILIHIFACVGVLWALHVRAKETNPENIMMIGYLHSRFKGESQRDLRGVWHGERLTKAWWCNVTCHSAILQKCPVKIKLNAAPKNLGGNPLEDGDLFATLRKTKNAKSALSQERK